MACKGSGVQIPSAPPQVRGPIRPRPSPDRPARAADRQQPRSRRTDPSPTERYTSGSCTAARRRRTDASGRRVVPAHPARWARRRPDPGRCDRRSVGSRLSAGCGYLHLGARRWPTAIAAGPRRWPRLPSHPGGSAGSCRSTRPFWPWAGAVRGDCIGVCLWPVRWSGPPAPVAIACSWCVSRPLDASATYRRCRCHGAGNVS
jgi:hypothetical protein